MTQVHTDPRFSSDIIKHGPGGRLLKYGRENPDLIGTAVEELLRFTAPVPCGAARIALEDVEVGDVIIPRGSSVLGMIISANRDKSVFDRAEDFHLGRQPNRHISCPESFPFYDGAQDR